MPGPFPALAPLLWGDILTRCASLPSFPGGRSVPQAEPQRPAAAVAACRYSADVSIFTVRVPVPRAVPSGLLSALEQLLVKCSSGNAVRLRNALFYLHVLA